MDAKFDNLNGRHKSAYFGWLRKKSVQKEKEREKRKEKMGRGTTKREKGMQKKKEKEEKREKKGMGTAQKMRKEGRMTRPSLFQNVNSLVVHSSSELRSTLKSPLLSAFLLNNRPL